MSQRSTTRQKTPPCRDFFFSVFALPLSPPPHTPSHPSPLTLPPPNIHTSASVLQLGAVSRKKKTAGYKYPRVICLQEKLSIYLCILHLLLLLFLRVLCSGRSPGCKRSTQGVIPTAASQSELSLARQTGGTEAKRPFYLEDEKAEEENSEREHFTASTSVSKEKDFFVFFVFFSDSMEAQHLSCVMVTV